MLALSQLDLRAHAQSLGVPDAHLRRLEQDESNTIAELKLGYIELCRSAPLDVELSIGQRGSAVRIQARCAAGGADPTAALGQPVSRFAEGMSAVLDAHWPGCSSSVTDRASVGVPEGVPPEAGQHAA